MYQSKICRYLPIAMLMSLVPQIGSSAISVISVSASGDGCPGDSARIIFAPDGNSFSVLYDRFEVRADSARSLVEKNCRLDMILQKNRDEMFQIESVDFRGFVQLDTGFRARQAVRTRVGGQGSRGHDRDFAVEHWRGPMVETYNFSTRPAAEGGTVDCAASDRTRMVIGSRVVVRSNGQARSGSGVVQVDSADGKMEEVYRLRWMKCTLPRRGGGSK